MRASGTGTAKREAHVFSRQWLRYDFCRGQNLIVRKTFLPVSEPCNFRLPVLIKFVESDSLDNETYLLDGEIGQGQRLPLRRRGVPTSGPSRRSPASPLSSFRFFGHSTWSAVTWCRHCRRCLFVRGGALKRRHEQWALHWESQTRTHPPNGQTPAGLSYFFFFVVFSLRFYYFLAATRALCGSESTILRLGNLNDCFPLSNVLSGQPSTCARVPGSETAVVQPRALGPVSVKVATAC